MVQFYRDTWQRRSHILAPLTDLVGKGKIKSAKTNNHQKAFDEMRAVITKETILKYIDFNKVFEIYTDASQYLCHPGKTRIYKTPA